MSDASMVQFSRAARSLATAARERELVVPSFRSPPRLLGVDRSIRRGRSYPVIAVRLRGRPWVAVAADMVEGIVIANDLSGADAVRVRGAMWAALGFATQQNLPASSRNSAAA